MLVCSRSGSWSYGWLFNVFASMKCRQLSFSFKWFMYVFYPGLFVFISPFLKIMEELYSGAGAACNSGASELSPIFCGVHVAQLYSSLWHFVNHCLSFCVLYLLDTALSVSLSFTASDIFKFFFITLLQTW